LRRVTDNKVVDFLRKRRERRADTAEIRSVCDAGPSPAEIRVQFWRNEQVKYCVEKARGRVSERNFQVLQMLLLDNLTVKKVCDQLGLNPSQVYKAKARVLKQMSGMTADFDSHCGR
jgi:DNA-directed RNA polymerase specialized sigma24 family protein